MLRIIFILLTVTALSLGAAWVADEPGRVVIDWSAYHVETSLLVLLAGIGIGALWCVIVYYIVYAVFRAPRSWLRSRLAKRQALGLEAMTAGFAAIATQDVRAARKHIGKARHYLPHQPLTLMLASQLARLEGNDSQSRLYLEQMLKADTTEFMALRGLVETARRAGDDDTALEHAEKALAVRPRDAWLLRTLIGLYSRKHRTQDALNLIERAGRGRALPRGERTRLAAMVFFEHARQLIARQRIELAIPALKETLRHTPDFAPASALLAECHREESGIAPALKVISAGWKVAPHPLLTEALLTCFKDATLRDKVTRRAEKLAHMHPEDRESRLLLAGVALKNAAPEIARNELQQMPAGSETVRSCIMMAEAERELGHPAEAAEWMKRSSAAPAEPGYACDQCHYAAEAWRLTCVQCGGVGSMEQRPRL